MATNLTTAKHKKILDDRSQMPILRMYSCNKCGQEYKYHSGLWRHKPKCAGEKSVSDYVEQLSDQVATVSTPVDSSLVIELLKQNQEFKEMMVEQHKILKETVIDKNITSN